MIKIQSSHAGFRRAGLAHSQEETEYADDFFTPEQLEILENEPVLTVIHTDEIGPISIASDPFAEVTALDKAFCCAIDCLDLDKSNRKDWTVSGVPRVKILEAIMGEDVSAAMCNTAFKMSQEKVITKFDITSGAK